MGSRILTFVSAVPLTGDQFARSVTVDIDPIHVMILGIEWIDRMLDPTVLTVFDRVFNPVEAVVMGAPYD